MSAIHHLRLLFLVAVLSTGCFGSALVKGFEPAADAPTELEHARNMASLKPPKRERPVVAVIGDNAGTETTDFLIPYAVLSASGLVDIVAVAPSDTPIALMPALTVMPEQTFDEFDMRYPRGADYVIVPALHHRDQAQILSWIQNQAEGNAIVIGICSGAMVLSEAGLLKDRSATTHWFDVDTLEDDNPGLRRVADRRYVVDQGIATTTGVSASVPMSLALVEAIGGLDAATRLARELGVDDWSPTHNSSAFQLDTSDIVAASKNVLSFWRREKIGIEVAPGVDEIALSLSADAYSRTYRSRAYTLSETAGPITMKHGLRLIPDHVLPTPHMDYIAPRPLRRHPARTLDLVLSDIESRYGRSTSAFVALQLEYPAPEPKPAPTQ